MTRLLRLVLIVALVIVLMMVFLAGIIPHRKNASGKFRLPVGGPDTPIVSIGATHGLILASDGSLWSWGSDFLGWPVLGLGNIHTQANLCQIGSQIPWVYVAAGTSHNLAIKSDGTLWAWGEDVHNQLGDGKRALAQNKPVPSVPGNNWKQAVPGGSHTIALKKDGTIWSWGNNWAGQLGINSIGNQASATQIGADHDWVRVWAGSLHSAALKADGSLWIWGDNPANATQAANTTNNLIAPTRFSPDTNWVDAAFGNTVFLAIKSDGTLWVWGRDAYMYSGISNRPAIPSRVGTNTDWQHVSSVAWARDVYTMLQKKDGSLWLMESSARTTNKLQVTEINLHKNWVAFGGGGGGMAGANGMHDGISSGIVLTRDGEVWAWDRAMGEFTPASIFMQALGNTLEKVHIKTGIGQAKPITRSEPWQIRNNGTNGPNIK